jgi:hypothetical protein
VILGIGNPQLGLIGAERAVGRPVQLVLCARAGLAHATVIPAQRGRFRPLLRVERNAHCLHAVAGAIGAKYSAFVARHVAQKRNARQPTKGGAVRGGRCDLAEICARWRWINDQANNLVVGELVEYCAAPSIGVGRGESSRRTSKMLEVTAQDHHEFRSFITINWECELFVVGEHLITQRKLLASHSEGRLNHLNFFFHRLDRVQLVDFNAEDANGRAEMEPHGDAGSPTSVVLFARSGAYGCG